MLFNAAPVGRFIFGREDSMSRHILQVSAGKGMRIVDVRQGYARCSTVIVGDSAIITQDRGIAGRARECGIDVLLVRPGHVRLDGYDTGFIGGASGVCRGWCTFAATSTPIPTGSRYAGS